MKISIIVPCHNLEKYIMNLLNSLEIQKQVNYENVELIFVLDDCIDKTKDTIENWLNNSAYIHNSIYVTNQHSAGLTRNIGKNHASGDYIWFIDGDDWLYHMQALYIVMGILTDNPTIEILHIPYKCNVSQITAERSVWQYIFKTSLIKDIEFTNKEIAEDTEFLQNAINKLQNKDNFKRIEGNPMYYYWHHRPGSLTTLFIEAHPELFNNKKE